MKREHKREITRQVNQIILQMPIELKAFCDYSGLKYSWFWWAIKGNKPLWKKRLVFLKQGLDKLKNDLHDIDLLLDRLDEN